MKIRTIEDYQELALSRGFKLIGEFPRTTRINTIWQCGKGHLWDAPFYRLKQGHGCPHCAGNARKTEQDYYDLASKCGFIWRAKEIPQNVVTKTKWECKNGHLFFAPYHNIDFGRGCRKCADRKSAKQPSDYHNIAKIMGFTWIGLYLGRSDIKTTWQCERGHEWDTTYNSVSQGRGCPFCDNRVNGVRASKEQIEIAKILSLSDFVNYRIKNKTVDVAILENKIAIEYDCWFWHKNKVKQDRERAQFLIDNGWKVLSVKANELIPSKQSLLQAIAKLESQDYYELVMSDWGK